jgi:hypothetical protein
MTQQEAWKYITDRNPDFLTSGAHLAPAGLKRLFDTAFEVGYKNGSTDGYDMSARKTNVDMPEFMKGLFK